MRFIQLSWRLLIISALFLTLSCQKNFIDIIDSPNPVLSIDEARNWFDNHSQKKLLDGVKKSKFLSLYPNWKSTKINTDYIEIQLVDSLNTKWFTTSSDSKKQVAAVQSFRKNLWLVLRKNIGGEIEEILKEVIPDTDEGFEINTFSGKVLLWNWNGELIGGNKYEKGISKYKISPTNNNQIKDNANARKKTIICFTWTVCEYTRICFLDDGSGEIRGTSMTSSGNTCSPMLFYHSDSNCYDWNLTSQYSYDQCFDDGQPAPGTGPTTPNPEQGQSNPCDHSTALSQNSIFKDKMNDLKGRVKANVEFGYVVQNNNYLFLQGATGSASINLPVTTPIDGLIHSHYTGLLSIFSADDIYAMAQLYKQGMMSNPSTFYLGVVTDAGTQYLLYIDNINTFSNFANSMSSSFQAYAFTYQNVFNILPANDALQNESNFLNYLRASNSGLRLHKGTNDLNGWSPIKSDGNGNTVANPCN